MTNGYSAALVERAIVVTCPDNDRGGASIPRADGWEDAAMDANPTLHALKGPVWGGAYVFCWRDDPRPDNELLAASLHIVKAAA
jgi:hypothetical protein